MFTTAFLDFGSRFRKKIFQKYYHKSSIIPTDLELFKFKTKKKSATYLNKEASDYQHFSVKRNTISNFID